MSGVPNGRHPEGPRFHQRTEDLPAPTPSVFCSNFIQCAIFHPVASVQRIINFVVYEETYAQKLTRPRASEENARMPHAKPTAIMLAAIATIYLVTISAQAQTSQKGISMPTHAAGPFDVKLTPQDDKLDPTLGRMTIDKQYHGDLEATSKGQMLTASTDVKGSAGYVAIERVTGTLRTAKGPRTGSFTLQHNATLTRGAPALSIIVVPDSGTAELVGLSGKMNIIISEAKHSYDFEYTLP
jgi:hypothetical protein